MIDRCYKLHGYPPGYIQGSSSSTQVGPSSYQKGKANNSSVKDPQSNFLASLTTEQYSQLVTMLQPHLQNLKVDVEKANEVTHVAGICSKPNLSYLDTWVIDSGASSHVCHNRSLFVSMHQTTINTYVTLLISTSSKLNILDQLYWSQT